MRLGLLWTWALATAAGVGPLAAQGPRVAVAVLPFENSGSYGQDKEALEALEAGIAVMLAGELAKHPAVQVVERGRVERVLEAQQVAPRTRVDAGMAAKIGQESAARYVVMGSFVDFYGRLRINARVVDASSGTILTVASNDDPALQDRARLRQSIQVVRDKIVAAIGLPPVPKGD
jgi:TolB-like protein